MLIKGELVIVNADNLCATIKSKGPILEKSMIAMAKIFKILK